MQTLNINQIRQNIDSLFSNFGNEPFLLKNDANQIFLLMPLTAEKWQEIIFLYSLINNSQIISQKIETQTETFEEFDNKWCGFLKNVSLPENWRDEYINEKIKKYE